MEDYHLDKLLFGEVMFYCKFVLRHLNKFTIRSFAFNSFHLSAKSHKVLLQILSVYRLGRSFGLFRNELLKFKKTDMRCDMIAGFSVTCR